MKFRSLRHEKVEAIRPVDDPVPLFDRIEVKGYR